MGKGKQIKNVCIRKEKRRKEQKENITNKAMVEYIKELSPCSQKFRFSSHYIVTAQCRRPFIF